MDKVLNFTVKIFIVLIMSAIGILTLTGAIALLFRTLAWISEVM